MMMIKRDKADVRGTGTGGRLMSRQTKPFSHVAALLSPEHDDGGICQRHLLNGIVEQDHGIGADETPEHQIFAFTFGTKEAQPGEGEI